MQRAFVDDAGHELRTPITIARGHLELMGDDPQERRETVALVTAELDHMARIVDELLVLAKSDQPDFVRPQPVEMADLTTELLAKARSLVPGTCTLEACADGVVLLDRQRIGQAVLNLARNAAEHTPPGTAVRIGSSVGDAEVRFWVADDGPGIPAGEQQQVFERFRRGVAGERRSEGAGLGLAIVRSVAAAHGGNVELTSSPGNGATFTLVIPLRVADWPAPDLTTHTEVASRR